MACELGAVPAYGLYIPLQVWLCRNYSLPLPLIFLQYHDVRTNIWYRLHGSNSARFRGQLRTPRHPKSVRVVRISLWKTERSIEILR